MILDLDFMSLEQIANGWLLTFKTQKGIVTKAAFSFDEEFLVLHRVRELLGMDQE